LPTMTLFNILLPHNTMSNIQNGISTMPTWWGVLFGLHQHKFNNPHFSQRLNHLPEWAIAMHGSYESKFVIRNLFNIWRSNSGKIQQLD
jgi:hypothetical protein